MRMKIKNMIFIVSLVLFLPIFVSAEVMGCTDTDATEEYLDGNNIYVAGTVTEINETTCTEGCEYSDACSNGEIVETYCRADGNESHNEWGTYPCPDDYECSEGACIEIVEEKEPVSEIDVIGCDHTGGVWINDECIYDDTEPVELPEDPVVGDDIDIIGCDHTGGVWDGNECIYEDGSEDMMLEAAEFGPGDMPNGSNATTIVLAIIVLAGIAVIYVNKDRLTSKKRK